MRTFIHLLLLAWTMTGNAESPERPGPAVLPLDGWRLVTDAVMGGVSAGRLTREWRAGRDCLCLAGRVRTERNGGFIQMVFDLDDRLVGQLSGHDGIRLEVLGNVEGYNVHLRTRDLWLPWQSFRAGFVAPPDWQAVDLPFDGFTPYRTQTALRLDRLSRVGIVAIGRAFDAEVCIAGVSLYRDDG